MFVHEGKLPGHDRDLFDCGWALKNKLCPGIFHFVPGIFTLSRDFSLSPGIFHFLPGFFTLSWDFSLSPGIFDFVPGFFDPSIMSLPASPLNEFSL